MPSVGKAADIESWLSDVRAFVLQQYPDIIPVLDAYAGEARYGRSYVADDLASLKADAQVLEVGAGSLLLSCQLAREGFQVMALEPVGRGFTHFDQLRRLVLECARLRGHAPAMLDLPAEQLDLVDRVDFAFSINVMEHVQDVPRVIQQVGRSLKSGGRYRFACANYLFPYEPHFNIFTLFSKSLTQRFRGHRIFNRPDIADSAGVWHSLNWISVPSVAKAVRGMPELQVDFNRKLLVKTVERMGTDPQFSARHSGLLRVILLPILRCRLQWLFGLVPAALQPVMDCMIVKRRATGEA